MAVVVPQSQQLPPAWTRSMTESDAPSPRPHDDQARDPDEAESSPSDEPKWPSVASRKRQRMTEEERKARHREVQRQFMQRKLAKLDEMRKLMALLEKQFQLLQLSQERARLEHENHYLQRRVEATPTHWSHEAPHEQQQRLRHARPHSHRPHTGMLPWDEILEAVSEANV